VKFGVRLRTWDTLPRALFYKKIAQGAYRYCIASEKMHIDFWLMFLLFFSRLINCHNPTKISEYRMIHDNIADYQNKRRVHHKIICKLEGHSVERMYLRQSCSHGSR